MSKSFRNILAVSVVAVVAILIWIAGAPGMGRSNGENYFIAANRPSVAYSSVATEHAAPQRKQPAPGAAITPPTTSGPIPVSKDDLGAAWPFTPPIVDGAVDCLFGNRPVFISGGTSYALTANVGIGPSLKRLGLVDFEGIWRDDPRSVRKGAKIDIEPMIALARRRCTK